MKSYDEIDTLKYTTDCEECIVDGWFCSLPIVTRDNEGKLIDNFFMYGSDFDFKTFSTPLVIFGIYSEEGKTAYKNWLPPSEVKELTLTEQPASVEEANKAFDRYKELYPLLREFAYLECNDEQKKLVQEYLVCLEIFSGPILWKFYQELFPAFFEWAQNL